jgi:hypothetical protein
MRGGPRRTGQSAERPRTRPGGQSRTTGPGTATSRPGVPGTRQWNTGTLGCPATGTSRATACHCGAAATASVAVAGGTSTAGCNPKGGCHHNVRPGRLLGLRGPPTEQYGPLDDRSGWPLHHAERSLELPLKRTFLVTPGNTPIHGRHPVATPGVPNGLSGVQFARYERRVP